MSNESTIKIGFLNVVASPHPEGIYSSSLRTVSNTPVNVRGKDFAIITPPQEVSGDPDIFQGVISVWTDIDPSEPSISKSTFEKKDVEAELKKVFAERGFNNRSFSYILDSSTHTIAVELKNENGKTLSIRQAGKVFEFLLSRENKDGQTFEVTIIPEEDALTQVLGLERIDKIVIVLKRPNPGDSHGSDADEVLRELHEQNIKRAEYNFSRQPATDGIHLNEANHTRAEVAASNGYVESSGVENGIRTKRSTQQYPKLVERVLAAGTIVTSALTSEVKRFRG
ncbi:MULTISPECIES: DUF4747 family protein [unclassified Sphingomonas]|jgi:hypothetical protein|uniref:DUF4747 family protein n=1 Tax=unclassified Sphingomonas TaxID=196159 RepID=UPI0009EB68D5|nr:MULTISPECIES: DUF4747 family protein [unclassified Sphingomonas]